MILKKKTNPVPSALFSNGNKIIVNGIRSSEEKWIFTNDDPQIIITFPQPVYGISYVCDLGAADFREGESILYFKEDKENYSDEKICKFPIFSNKRIERKVLFSRPVYEIRFDPVDFTGRCIVKQMKLEGLSQSYTLDNVVGEYAGRVKEGYLVFSHNLSETGAPILAYHIAKTLKERGQRIVLITGKCGNGFLEERLEESNIPFISLRSSDYMLKGLICVDTNNKVMDSEELVQLLFGSLFKLGYRKVIANTVVSGQFVKKLKIFDFKVVSLIHEMKTSIQLCGYYNGGIDISRYADYIVFPNNTVKDDFLELYGCVSGECVVRPQGVYLKEQERIEDDRSFAEFMKEQGLSTNKPIIMSSGTCDLRKGIDLFITSAIMFNRRNQQECQFVWTGGFYDEGMQAWMEEQISRAGCGQQIHIIPFIKDQRIYGELLKRASVFWAMSREDPFPSTVLEAMKNNVPVIGFKGTGGIEVMLSDNRGKLIEQFDLIEVIDFSSKLIQKPDLQMITSAKKYVDHLNFGEYIDFIQSILD